MDHLPNGQVWHSLFCSSNVNLPASHASQDGIMATSVPYLPGGQPWHSCCPIPDVNIPSLQVVHWGTAAGWAVSHWHWAAMSVGTLLVHGICAKGA